MKLIYQWVPWAYSNIACFEAKELLNEEITDITWMIDFKSVWESIDKENIAILPVENSYAWNIHENLYNFLRYDYKIIWEINLEINHCLLSKEDDIKNITQVYSHPQALSQCHDYLKKNNIKPIIFWDTAWAAEMIVNKSKEGIWAIASTLAWDIYWLNILDEAIQDQNWNTTKFFIIAPKDLNTQIKNKKWKTSIIFETKNIPAALYKCLWAFATNNVNLTKIESMPSLKWPFTYLFWMNFEWKLEDENVAKSLHELEFFTKQIKILWEY
jgi:prephenate dehydratase